MPYSPFTRFLGCVLVVLAALALLWPDDRTLQWAAYGTGAVAILLMVFTWSAVRNSPPLDDQAFHQCLPEGVSRAFFRTVWIHLLVLAGVAVVVLVYCGVWNFSWRAASYGVAMLTLPVWALMSAMGVASSASSSRQAWKSAAWFAIFAMPLFSWGLLYVLNDGVEKYVPEEVYFPPVRTLVLTGATLYPLVWWLVAARKRRRLGLVLGGATGALLPWLWIYGDFAKVPVEEKKPGAEEVVFLSDGPRPLLADGRITVTRKPFQERAERWIPMEDLVEVKGMAEGEQVGVMLSIGEESSKERERLYTWEVRDETRAKERGVRYVEAIALNRGGKVVWGAGPRNEGIRAQLPPVETFEYWDGRLNQAFPQPVIANPAVADFQPASKDEERRPFSYRYVTAEAFRTKPWSAWVSTRSAWKLLVSCAVSEGASVRLEHGGRLEVVPLSVMADAGPRWPAQAKSPSPAGSNHGIELRCSYEDLWVADGPWFGKDTVQTWSGMDVLMVIIDETGKHAYLSDELDFGGDGKLLLGRYDRRIFDAGAGDTPESLQRIEMVRKGRVYVFASQWGAYPEMMKVSGS
ncbi:hypothetical protein [Luteolibacter soli]|uniref:Uncharacterized protein n=1 Tax=Luteolibacter soli TaxID=3135280 RepID=A0ABU9AX18_9BACT